MSDLRGLHPTRPRDVSKVICDFNITYAGTIISGLIGTRTEFISFVQKFSRSFGSRDSSGGYMGNSPLFNVLIDFDRHLASIFVVAIRMSLT